MGEKSRNTQGTTSVERLSDLEVTVLGKQVTAFDYSIRREDRLSMAMLLLGGNVLAIVACASMQDGLVKTS